MAPHWDKMMERLLSLLCFHNSRIPNQSRGLDSCVFLPCLWLFTLLWQRLFALCKWKTSPDTLALAHRGDPEVYLSNPIAPSVSSACLEVSSTFDLQSANPTAFLPLPRPNDAQGALLVDIKFQFSFKGQAAPRALEATLG